LEKGHLVTRTLVARDLDGEQAGFPLAAQAARLHRQREDKASETVELITSRPKAELLPAQWLHANISHWGIETGLHARLDASRHDDRCRLRRRKAVRIHGMFNRWANSLFIHWRTRAYHTTTDFITAMAENHDRRAVSTVLSLRFPS
jgi:predicted transposase YbfD/YdcC